MYQCINGNSQHLSQLIKMKNITIMIAISIQTISKHYKAEKH
jgi:hypothetical protein